MTEIEKIHDVVFEFLMEWSESQPQNSLNRFFYLRSKNDDRFKKGYWFPGDEKFVAVSFWTGGDSLNRTSNIYLSFDPKNGVYANLVARDSENKRNYFEKLVGQLNGYKLTKTKGIWRKKIGYWDSNNLINYLKEFVNHDKEIIDKILKRSLDRIEEPDSSPFDEEFGSKFGFISEEQFFKLKSRVESEKIRIRRDSKISTLSLNTLPYTLSKVSIENFQGIKKTLVTDLPEDCNWIFLTGENGFGKTSVLQAIALGLTNYDENREYLKDGGKLDVSYNHKGLLQFNSSSFAYTTEFIGLNDRFVAYGPIRLNAQASSSENQESKNSSNIYNLFNRDGLLKNINYLLLTASLKKSNEFDNLRNAIIKVLDKRILDITIDSNGIVQYYESDDNQKLIATNPLDRLATGFQGLINLIGDIIFRFSRTFVDIPFKDYQGIVLIDELENHLHPVFQKKLPTLLSNLFPNIQFIASIHSPIPILGSPLPSVIIKVDRTYEDGITIERIDNKFDFKNLSPNAILTSPIFGLKDIFPIGFDRNKERMNTEDIYDDFQLKKAVRTKLDDFLKNEK